LGPHRFLVVQKVGEGGFGQVYKAIEIHSGHTVAIKTVSRKGLSRSRVDATLKEQKIAQRIARHQRQAIGNGGDYVVRMLASFLTPNYFVFILVSINLGMSALYHILLTKFRTIMVPETYAMLTFLSRQSMQDFISAKW